MNKDRKLYRDFHKAASLLAPFIIVDGKYDAICDGNGNIDPQV
ncbi:hypothetical protein [Nostoc sp. PCC 9305]